MAHQSEMHVGDIGTEIRAQIKDENGAIVDVSAAATRTLYLLKPGSFTAIAKTAAAGSIQDPTKTGALGWMHYTTIAGDIDIPGSWQAEGYVDLGSWKGRTAITRFSVGATL